MGAMGEGGVRVLNETLVRSTGITPDELAAGERRERAELERWIRRFQGIGPVSPWPDGRWWWSMMASPMS
ncbi:MAG: hypothetical protein ACRDTH_13255 [Pseudonocardiaceae bacterium]